MRSPGWRGWLCGGGGETIGAWRVVVAVLHPRFLEARYLQEHYMLEASRGSSRRSKQPKLERKKPSRLLIIVDSLTSWNQASPAYLMQSYTLRLLKNCTIRLFYMPVSGVLVSYALPQLKQV